MKNKLTLKNKRKTKYRGKKLNICFVFKNVLAKSSELYCLHFIGCFFNQRF